MFETIIAKKEVLNENETLIFNLFIYIEKNNEEKIISYIKNKSYKIWLLKDESGFNILHKSCYLNNTSISKIIIQETRQRLGYTLSFTSFINSKTNEGLTPLHYAAYEGNLEISKLLINNGADYTTVTNLGKNVLHLTAEGNQPSLMLYYFNKKIFDISCQDFNKSTPLHWACYSGAFESIKFLINLNAEINSFDKNELTPLHLATLYNKKNIVVKLLQNGAVKDVTNSKGETPLYLAWKRKYKKIYDLLNEKKFWYLWTIKTPWEKIEPNDIYKKYIIIVFIIYQLFIILMILPFLKNIFDIFFNNILFLLNLTLLIILLLKNPGYKYIENKNGINPLIKLIEDNKDIKTYCPKCFLPEVNGIKHCIICDKCVEGFNHHCFWINKCIGKKNKLIYLLFLFISLIYTLDSIYISILSLLDFSSLSYNKFIYKNILNTSKQRQIRVFFIDLIFIFSIFICFPLFFLLFNELNKKLKKKKFCDKLSKKKDLNNTTKKLELKKINKKEIIINDDKYESNIINSTGTNRETNNNNDNDYEEIKLIENNNGNEYEDNIIPIAQTPFLKNNNNLLCDNHLEE